MQYNIKRLIGSKIRKIIKNSEEIEIYTDCGTMIIRSHEFEANAPMGERTISHRHYGKGVRLSIGSVNTEE